MSWISGMVIGWIIGTITTAMLYVLLDRAAQARNLP